MSLRFHHFVSDVNQENEDFESKQGGSRSSCVTTGMERFSLDLLQAVKKMCFGCGMWVCVEFAVAG